MKMTLLPGLFAICRLNPEEPIPSWALSSPLFFLSRTNEELSIICMQNYIPEGVVKNNNWRCLKIEGPLNFTAVGILNSIIQPLTQKRISLLAFSTYETDYFLVREEQLKETLQTLSQEGIKLRELA